MSLEIEKVGDGVFHGIKSMGLSEQWQKLTQSPLTLNYKDKHFVLP